MDLIIGEWYNELAQACALYCCTELYACAIAPIGANHVQLRVCCICYVDDFQIEPKVENAENNVNELNQCELIAIGTSPVLQQKCCSSWHHSLSEDKVHDVVR